MLWADVAAIALNDPSHHAGAKWFPVLGADAVTCVDAGHGLAFGLIDVAGADVYSQVA